MPGLGTGSLAGRTIVVTGAARGLGREIAAACAREGAVLILADVLEDLVRQTAEDMEREGFSVRALAVDLGDPKSIERLAADIAAREGAIDGLVNNAAIATDVGGPTFEQIEIELWDKVMQVNVRGTWLITRALAPLMGEGARIVNFASDTALWGAPNLLAYVASKGAIISMTRSLARELGPRRIGVSAVAPGIVRVEATDYVPAARHQFYETNRAVPGPQYPQDITGAVTFLLTDGALAVTGQLIPVNAGIVFA